MFYCMGIDPATELRVEPANPRLSRHADHAATGLICASAGAVRFSGGRASRPSHSSRASPSRHPLVPDLSLRAPGLALPPPYGRLPSLPPGPPLPPPRRAVRGSAGASPSRAAGPRIEGRASLWRAVRGSLPPPRPEPRPPGERRPAYRGEGEPPGEPCRARLGRSLALRARACVRGEGEPPGEPCRGSAGASPSRESDGLIGPVSEEFRPRAVRGHETARPDIPSLHARGSDHLEAIIAAATPAGACRWIGAPDRRTVSPRPDGLARRTGTK